VLALDTHGRIEAEYRRMLGDTQSLGLRFVALLASRNRIRLYGRPSNWKPVRVALDGAHMSMNDRPFVETAAESQSKLLVANDDDYSPKVRRILRQRAQVRVLSETEATECLAET
jgi:hypothetical protein